MYTAYPMTVNQDRLVSPTMHIPSNARGATLIFPTLDDAANITLESAPLPHRFNYPAVPGGYSNKGVVCEFDFDVAATVTSITDKASGLVLAEQGDPTPHASAATPGLGQTMTYDGTGDAHDALWSSIPPDLTQIFAKAAVSGKTLGDFSVEVVVKGTNASAGNLDTIICCRDGLAGVGWALQYDANQYIDLAIDDGTETLVAGTVDMATDAYVHALVSVDRDGNCVIYNNGTAGTTTDISARTGSLFNPSADTRFAIGGNAARTATSNLYGSMAFARIYNRVVPAAEAAENYQVLMGKGGYPGWSEVAGLAEVGADGIVGKTGSAPNRWVMTRDQVEAIKGQAFRLRLSVEQTTTPSEIPFGVMYN